MFDIMARRTLLHYYQLYPLAANALKHWYADSQEREFTDFSELKATYGNVSVVADDRAVFNIMDNKYRLVARMVFSYKTVQIKWFGTHSEYDRIDSYNCQLSKAMTLKTIKSEQEYDELMAWIDAQFDRKVMPDSADGEALQVALLLIKSYEDEHYAIPLPDPIKAI